MALNQSEKARYVSRILSGVLVLRCQDDDGKSKRFLFVNPTPLERMLAEERYHDTIEDSSYRGIMTLEESVMSLESNELWSAQQEEEVEKLPDTIEQLKVDLYNSYFKQTFREKIRKQLIRCKNRLLNLYQDRHQLEYVTQEGVAKLARNQYLLGCGLRNFDGSRIWDGYDFLDTATRLIDSALPSFMSQQLDETIIRELAHTEPWRTIWIAGKTENSILGKPSAEFNEEQKAILLWSRMYDNVHESPNSPIDNIIEDDDVLDGWLISENRKQEQEKMKSMGEEKFGGKKGDQEVFIPVDGKDDFDRVHSMNDVRSRLVQKQRFNKLHQKGTVKEQDMPDSKLKIRSQAMQQYKEHVRNKK